MRFLVGPHHMAAGFSRESNASRGRVEAVPFMTWFQKSPVAQTTKNLPAIQETQVQSLGREDALEEKMATHSSILAWKIPLCKCVYIYLSIYIHIYVYVLCLVAQSCPTLCNPMDCSLPGFPVLHYLPEFAQTRVH